MMRTPKILLFLFISCLCFGCQSSLRRESRIEKQDDVYVLSFANLSFSVSAGRVVGLFLLNVKIGSC